MDRTVQSMLETTPLRSPRHGTLPTPSTVMPSVSTSPTTAATLVVPMSRPTTISEVSKRPFMNSPTKLLRLHHVVFRGRCDEAAPRDGQNATARQLVRRCQAGSRLGELLPSVRRSPHRHHDALGGGQ